MAVCDEQVINPVTLELLHNTGCATISADLHIVLVNAFIPTLAIGNRFAVVSVAYLLSRIFCRVSKEELVKLIFPLGPAVLGLALSLSAQQAPPATQNPDTTTAQPQPEVDTAMQRRSAQSFEGKITRSGEKLVLRENASKIAYQLDDQEKARKYEGRDVKVMGTVEAPNNVLHIVDIMAIETN